MAVQEDWNVAAGVKGLSEDGASLPSKFVRPVDSRIKKEEFCFLEGVPVIDLSQQNVNIIEEVANAAENWGFFQVDKHDVPLGLMESMLSVSREFFNMPSEDKMAYYSEDLNSLVGYGASYSPSGENYLEWHDHLLHRFPSLEESHPWPEKPASYREIAENYLKQVAMLAEQIAGLLSEALGLKPGHIHEAMKSPQVYMRLNYYPPCTESELVLGQSPHCDYGVFTIIMENIEGLQVKHNGNWRTVKTRPGAFMVVLADQLELWSNQRFKSARHRVAVNPTEARLSVAAFFTPNSKVFVSPIPELLDETHPPVYQGCVYEDYQDKTSIYYNQEARVIDSLKI